MVKTHGLTHIALAVADAERSLRFYRKVFGVKLVYRESVWQVMSGVAHAVFVFMR